MDKRYLEQCMFKGILQDKSYAVSVLRMFDAPYFDSVETAEIFQAIKEYTDEYSSVPEESIIISKCEQKEKVKKFLDSLNEFDFSVVRSRDWLIDQTNEYLKEKAVEDAIVKSVQLLETKGDRNNIRTIVENALAKDLKVRLGLNYFEDVETRLDYIFNNVENKVPTGYPILDEFINGGLPPSTLSVFVAKSHGFKSNLLANIASRMVLNGKNVALASLEMSEMMYSQRFDGIFGCLDINKMYVSKPLQDELHNKLTDLKKCDGLGNLIIKDFPPAKSTVNDYRLWLRELAIRDIHIDVFLFDYINLVKAELSKTDNSYREGKAVAEDARGLGFEFQIPIVSVSQLNRTGTFLSFDEVDFNSIADSYAIAQTADFISILGFDKDRMVYESEVQYKIVKNRMGGRVGEIGKFFYDSRSLKMYCETELDMWLDDCRNTGGKTNLFEGE